MSKLLLKGRMIDARDSYYRGLRVSKFTKFWLQSPLHYAIVLEIGVAELDGSCINFEGLMKRLPNLGSRSTVGYVVDDFIQAKFVCKSVGQDKRKRFYTVCPNVWRELESWFRFWKVSLKEEVA